MSKNLKILHIVRQFEPAVGGLEIYVKNMCKQQIKEGHNCTVLTLDRVFHSQEHQNLAHDANIDGIHIKRVSFVGHRRFFLPFLNPSYLKKFDIIHVHNTDFFFDLMAIYSLVVKTPMFATTHGGFFHTKDFSGIKKIYFNFITRLTAKAYKGIFAISGNDFDTFKGLNKNLMFQPNAIKPLGDFTSTGKDFLYIGRLAKHKHVERVIRVFANLKQKHNVESDLHIIGPSWDVTLEELDAVAKAQNIEDHVKLHGFIAQEDFPKVLKSSGYFLSASSFEGFGMSMLEAMSVGMIPFVEPNQSFEELVEKGGIGKCVDFDKTDEAAAQIAEALSGTTLEMREEARKYASTFSWEELVNNTHKEYEKHV